MTTRFTLADPTRHSAAASADGIRLSPAGRERASLAVGDAVRIESGDATVATVGEDAPALPEEALLAGETVRRNAEATPGASLTVEPVTPVPARSVTVRPTQSFSLDGDTEALSRVLAGRHLSTGDRIEARLFGGSVVVSLVVVGLDPPGPVVVTDETTVVVREADSQPTGDASVPALSAADIGGLDEERSTLRRLVAMPLSNPDSYGAVGARTPAGVLLSGPSGAGKTLLVRTVAAEAELPVEELTPSDCETRESLAAVLRSVDDEAPAILLVQDLAAVAPNPDDASRSHSALGWLLDRVRERDDLIVVGETTDADAVDPALRRGGRFDTELRVGGLTA
ncbi:MAG: AAA family ATPase, partial [Halohasta sp.]